MCHSHLKGLFLENNDLRGGLPASWNLTSLATVVLSNNQNLGGTLPASLFLIGDDISSHVNRGVGGGHVLYALRAVVIEGARLSGTIPHEICKAPQLATLALSGNMLTGSLPACLPYMHSLQALHLTSNSISGKRCT